MPEIRSWTVTYYNKITGTDHQAAVFAADHDGAMKNAEKSISDNPDMWEIRNIQETVFPEAEPQGRSWRMGTPVPKTHESEVFYDREEALACQAAHPGAEITDHPGFPVMLGNRITYEIPENRPHWTVTWPV